MIEVVLADDQDPDAVVAEASPVEHRPELPAKPFADLAARARAGVQLFHPDDA